MLNYQRVTGGYKMGFHRISPSEYMEYNPSEPKKMGLLFPTEWKKTCSKPPGGMALSENMLPLNPKWLSHNFLNFSWPFRRYTPFQTDSNGGLMIIM